MYGDTRETLAQKAHDALSVLIDLPRTTVARDVLSACVGLSHEATAREHGIYTLRGTSGTSTGIPILCLQKIQTRLYEERFKAAKRSLSVNGAHGTRLFFAIIASLVHTSCVFKAIDIKEINDIFGNEVEKFDPDSIMGFPGYIAYITPFLLPKTRGNIRELFFSGERLSEVQEQYFKEQYPSAHIRMFYGAAECGTITDDQCPYLPINYYHPAAGVRVESTSANEQEGMLLLTSFREGMIPIDRYMIGDRGRIINKKCPCGADVTFEVLGRSTDEYVSLCGARFSVAALETALKAAQMHPASARISLKEKSQNGKITGCVTLLVQEPLLETAIHNADTFSSALRVTGTQFLSDLMRDGTFAPLEIAIDSPTYEKKRIFRI